MIVSCSLLLLKHHACRAPRRDPTKIWSGFFCARNQDANAHRHSDHHRWDGIDTLFSLNHICKWFTVHRSKHIITRTDDCKLLPCGPCNVRVLGSNQCLWRWISYQIYCFELTAQFWVAPIKPKTNAKTLLHVLANDSASGCTDTLGKPWACFLHVGMYMYVKLHVHIPTIYIYPYMCMCTYTHVYTSVCMGRAHGYQHRHSYWFGDKEIPPSTCITQ